MRRAAPATPTRMLGTTLAVMSDPFAKQPQDNPDQALIIAMTPITIAFVIGLFVIGAVMVLFVVTEPAVRGVGLLVGVVLGLVSWFAPRRIIRGALDRARDRGVEPSAVPDAVRSAVFAGIAAAEVPALVAVVLVVESGHDVGALLVSLPVAIVSLIFNVSGPDALRQHLARLREPSAR